MKFYTGGLFYIKTVLPVLLFVSLRNVAFGQKIAPVSHLIYHGFAIENLPGEYPSALTVLFSHNAASSLVSYDSKIKLIKSSIGSSINLNETSTISLRFLQNKQLSDTLYVGTYIIGKKSDLPVVCLYLKREDFDGPGGIITGELIKGEGADTNMIPVGRIWKKETIPVFVEYYEKEKTAFHGMFRVKPFGGMTLNMPERSLRLITDSAIGPKKIKISPFTNKKFNSYKSIVLRTSGNDQAATRIKDISLSSIAKDLNLDYLDYRQAVLYINGEYWGIYNLREKTNLEYLKYNHGAPKDPKITTLDITGIGVPDYLAMLDFIKRPFPENSAIDSINKKIVFENYINYIIWQIHTINIDSRGNVRFWKSKALDNRWRWIYYDGDQSCFLSQVNLNYLSKRISVSDISWCNPEWATVTLRNLLSHRQTKNFFINEYCLLLGTRLHTDTLINRINHFANIIRTEIPHHVLRRNRISPQTAEQWEKQVELFREFFRQREKTAFSHIRESFSLKGELKPLKISSNITDLKTLRLRYSTFLFSMAEAKFFDDIPIEFEAVDLNPKYKFQYWEQNPGDTSRICVADLSKISALRAVYKRKAFSSLRNKIRINFSCKKESKRDSFYVIGITNVSGRIIKDLCLRFQHALIDNTIKIKLISLKKEETFYLTNNISKTKKTIRKGVFAESKFPKGFRLNKQEWVLLDEKDCIVDSLFIEVQDSIVNSKKSIFFYRNKTNNQWESAAEFLVMENAANIQQPSEIKKLILLITGFSAFVGLLIFIFRRKKNKSKITGLVLFVLLWQGLKSQDNFHDRFGLDSLHTKLVNNHGQGFEKLTGCRNVRVVLKNLLYRGGNNHSGSFQNPLELKTIQELKLLDFNKAIYLYEKNFRKFYNNTRIDSLKHEGFTYNCSPHIDSDFVHQFLSEVKEQADQPKPKLVYIHCWNGWHQSGRLSAITLIQFCDFTPELAVRYWAMNTDGNHNGYQVVKKSILNFKPFRHLAFTKEQKEKYCPCFNEMQLNKFSEKRKIKTHGAGNVANRKFIVKKR